MQTSYFAKYKGADGINIAIRSAPGFTGPSYPKLFPKWSFLKQYKIDKIESVYTAAYYDQILNKLDPQEVYNELQNKTLLCWEKSGKFCHRRLVAQWIKNELDIIILEYK